MAVTIQWPSTLPERLSISGYSEAPNHGVVSTSIEGAKRYRRRTRAITKPITGRMVLTKTELSIFKAFFNTTIKGGVLPFNFPNPYDINTTIKVRWNAPSDNNPYSISYINNTDDVEITINLEELP